jgi:hypothetical protein
MVCYAWCVPACLPAPESMACLRCIRRIHRQCCDMDVLHMPVRPYSSPSLTQTRVDGQASSSTVIVIAHGKGKDFDAACQTLPLPTRALPPPDGPHLVQASCMLVALAGALALSTACSQLACLWSAPRNTFAHQHVANTAPPCSTVAALSFTHHYRRDTRPRTLTTAMLSLS